MLAAIDFYRSLPIGFFELAMRRHDEFARKALNDATQQLQLLAFHSIDCLVHYRASCLFRSARTADQKRPSTRVDGPTAESRKMAYSSHGKHLLPPHTVDTATDLCAPARYDMSAAGQGLLPRFAMALSTCTS